MKTRLLALLGPSGSGKTTIQKLLLKRMPAARVLRSYTTRPPRASDIPGEYEHVTPVQMRRMALGGTFAWHREYVGGIGVATSRADLMNALDRRREELAVSVLIPDVLPDLFRFAREISARDLYRDAAERIMCVYIDASEATRRRRLCARGTSPEDVKRRIMRDRRMEAVWKAAEKEYGRQALFLRVENDRDGETYISKAAREVADHV